MIMVCSKRIFFIKQATAYTATNRKLILGHNSGWKWVKYKQCIKCKHERSNDMEGSRSTRGPFKKAGPH